MQEPSTYQNINSKLAEIEDAISYQGILDCSGFKFRNTEDMDALLKWINNSEYKRIHILRLQACNISEAISYTRQIQDTNLEWLSPLAYLPSSTIQKGRLKGHALCDIIRTKQWSEINLASNNFTGTESRIIIEAIASTQLHLRRLVLDGNVIQQDGMELLSKFLLNKNCSLKYLSLQNTLIASELSKLLRALTTALENNRTLREVDLRLNQLRDDHCPVLINPLSKNTTLIAIYLEAQDFTEGQLELLKLYLERNRKKRVELHDMLISPAKLIEEAVAAIKGNNVDWLDVLIGVNKQKQQEENDFNTIMTNGFFEIQSLTFSLEITELYQDFYKKLQGNLDNIQVDGKRSALQAEVQRVRELTIELLEERLTRDHDLTPAKVTAIKQKFIDDIIEPTLQHFSAQLLLPNVDLDALLTGYEQRIYNLNTEIEAKTKTHTALQEQHYSYLERYQRLIRKLQHANPDTVWHNEWEEIAEKLIEAQIDVNTSINEKGDTLSFYSLSLNRPDCLALLLNHGADVLLQNKDGKSIFSELLSVRTPTLCHTIIIQHILEIIKNMWLKLGDYSIIEKLERIKNILDNYLVILIKKNQMHPIRQTITGATKCLAERKVEIVEYYDCLRKAYENTSTLDQTLVRMLEIAQQAKRGVLNKSQLHDTIKETLLPFIDQNNKQIVAEFQEIRVEFSLNIPSNPDKEEEAESRRASMSFINILPNDNGSCENAPRSPLKSFFYTCLHKLRPDNPKPAIFSNIKRNP